MCKCYRSSLEKLVTNNPSYKGKGGLTEKMRKRLTSAAHCAIKMRSQEADRNVAVRLLERDLLDGPFHCFGYHDKCSPDFCSTVRQNQHRTDSNYLSTNPSSTTSSDAPAAEDEVSTSGDNHMEGDHPLGTEKNIINNIQCSCILCTYIHTLLKILRVHNFLIQKLLTVRNCYGKRWWMILKKKKQPHAGEEILLSMLALSCSTMYNF